MMLSGRHDCSYLLSRAQRPRFRDRSNINVEQVQSEIEEALERFRENPGLLNPVSRMMLKD